MAMTRRGFLQGLLGATAAAVVLDPEKLLWVPGQKTFFLPSQDIVEARTLVEAINAGLIAIYPDGTRLEANIGEIGGWPKRLPHAQAVEQWISRVTREGGRVIENRAYKTHTVGAN